MINIINVVFEDDTFFKEMLYEALYVREGEKPFPKSIIDTPDLKKYYEDWGRLGDIGGVLMNKGLKVGLCWSRLFTKEQLSYGFVNEKTPELTIALKAEYRNKGLGSRLINYIVEENLKIGFQQISLSVDQESPALRLYQRLGFRVYKEEGTAFTMMKEINKKNIFNQKD